MPAMVSTITSTRREPSLVRIGDAIDLHDVADSEQDVFGSVGGLAFAGDQLHVIGFAGEECFCDDFPRIVGATGALDFERKSRLRLWLQPWLQLWLRPWLRPSLLLSLCLHGLVAGAFLMSARHEPAFQAPVFSQPLRIGLRENNPLRPPLPVSAVELPIERDVAVRVEPLVETVVVQPSEPDSTRTALSDSTAALLASPALPDSLGSRSEADLPASTPSMKGGAQSLSRQVLSVSDSPYESARLAPSAEVVRDALSRSSLSDSRHWRRPCTEKQRRSDTLNCEQEVDNARFSALESNLTYSALQPVRARSRSARALLAMAENSARVREALVGMSSRTNAAVMDQPAGYGVYLLEELEAGITLGSAAGDRNQQQMKRVTDTTAAATMVERILNDPWIRNATLVRRSRRVVD